MNDQVREIMIEILAIKGFNLAKLNQAGELDLVIRDIDCYAES